MALSGTVLVLVAVLTAGASALSWADYGMHATSTAYEAVCWYEFLKKFPNTNSNAFMKCTGQVEFLKPQIKTDKDGIEDFGNWMSDPMEELPKAYDTACQKYRKDANANPASDEGDALNDANRDDPYPFKAFAYCLMSQLRRRHGAQAIKAVKEERTHSRKHWRTTFLDRDNEFRARHGVEPLTVMEDLNNAAQKWAQTNADNCKSEHSENGSPGQKWRGQDTGESLSTSESADVKEVNAYIASDGWYEEIKDYPYPGGFDGKNKALEKKIGHFTQTVWKETKFVGYGYAYNKRCKQWFIVARYSPAGNGNYKKNVMPIKD